MISKDFNDYLTNLEISDEDKKYASSFFKKKNYIDKLNDTAIKTFNGESLMSGLGNYNSSISIIIEDNADFNNVISFIEPVFNYINTSLWNMYITFHKKTSFDTNSIYNEMLKHEISAINPSIIIRFCEKETLSEDTFDTDSSKIKTVNINMDDVKYALNKEHFKDERYSSIMNNVYNFIIQMIPYREIEILE